LHNNAAVGTKKEKQRKTRKTRNCVTDTQWHHKLQTR